MPYYLTQYNEIKPGVFVPEDGGQGAHSCLDCRGDVTKVDGAGRGLGLLWVPKDFSSPRAVKLGDGPDDPVGPLLKTAVEQASQLSGLAVTTVRDVFREIATKLDRPLRPGRDGVMRILIGAPDPIWNTAMGGGIVGPPTTLEQRHLVADDFVRYPAKRERLFTYFGIAVVLACLVLFQPHWYWAWIGTTLGTDDFNRADSGTPGANWSTPTGFAAHDIIGNQLGPDTGTTPSRDYYSAVAWPGDQWSQATLSGTISGHLRAGTAVRMASGADTVYVGGHNPGDFSNSNRRLWKYVAGTNTSIATQAVDIASGDLLYTEIQGTALALKIGGLTQVTGSDASIATGSAGIDSRYSSDPATLRWDNWSGGDFAAAGAGGPLVSSSKLKTLVGGALVT